jgi:FtsH-binding integral membrane protein
MAKEPKPLHEHVFATYITLRVGMITFAVVLPFVVWAWGYFVFGIPLQQSLSAYYWASSPNEMPPLDSYLFDQFAPSRVWFVGFLFAIAACLYLYKGFSPRENYALNLAAVLTVGVAIFPTCWRDDCGGSVSVHGVCAIAAFACLFYVMWRRSGDTLALLPESKRRRYRRTYKFLGLAVFGLPVMAAILNAFVGSGGYIFFIEAASLWLFAGYWWLKTRELKQTNAQERVLKEEPVATAALKQAALKKAA